MIGLTGMAGLITDEKSSPAKETDTEIHKRAQSAESGEVTDIMAEFDLFYPTMFPLMKPKEEKKKTRRSVLSLTAFD